MKTILLIVLLAGCTYARPYDELQIEDGVLFDEAFVGIIGRQRLVNRLLYKLYDNIQPKFTDLIESAGKYVPEDHQAYYSDNGKAVKELSQNIKDKRVLEQRHWFSLFNAKQRAEAILLFESLMYAKSWNIFANTAAHYREKLNEGVFAYGFYVAILHSEFGKGVVLPPLYEVMPHLFTNTQIIQQAYSAKMKQTPGKFRMSFTGTKRNPEQRVAYFGEDIGLNLHHVTWHMDYPFWWKDSYRYHIDRKGELFFWVHHQLTTRFDSERLSNNLAVVDALQWDKPIKDGFSPHTTYKFGGEFPSRPDNVKFEDVDGVARIRDLMTYENRIRDAIAHGYITGRDGSAIDIRNERGIELLGDILESSEYSTNTQYYGALHNLAHIVLGRQGDPHGKFGVPPGVMEHFETATRDPAFFRLHKYMDNIFKEHKYALPPYTEDDISFTGVALESVAVDGKLETFFEDFQFELGNGVDETDKYEDLELIAIVSRLNHAKFNYKLEISNNNDADVLGTIRIYLCPTYDSNGIKFTWENGAWGCIEMDKFWRTLNHGKNKIERSSDDSSITVPDVPGYRFITDKTQDALDAGEEVLGLEAFTRSCGIPNRLLLPKGKKEGMDFAILVAVTSGKEDVAVDGMEKDTNGRHAHCGSHGEIYPDKQPMGYPFDRQIPDPRVFTNSVNIKTEYVKVFHRE